MRRKPFLICLAAVTLASFPRSSQAGPPIICHTIEIGDAASLPFGSKALQPREDYSPDRLVGETLQLLQPQTPVLVRMETLRRAALYGARNPEVGQALLAALLARALEAAAAGSKDGLAWFDAGFLVEAYKETTLYGGEFQRRLKAKLREGDFRSMPGHAWVLKAIELRGQDPDMEFAAALITWDEDRSKHDAHLHKAIASAVDGSLLARNLLQRFGEQAKDLAALKAKM